MVGVCLSSGKSLGKEKTVKGASISEGREDEGEPTEEMLEEQVEEVRGEPPNF